MKYKIDKFDINDKELLWEAFMKFVRKLIPYKKSTINKLSDIQRCPVIAFIYTNEVFGDGHIQFFDLYQTIIKISDVKESLANLNVDEKFIKNLDSISDEFTLPENWFDDYDKYESIFEVLDNQIYSYGEEAIYNKMIRYIINNFGEIFEFNQV